MCLRGNGCHRKACDIIRRWLNTKIVVPTFRAWIKVKWREDSQPVRTRIWFSLGSLLENKQISTQRMSGNLSIILWEEPSFIKLSDNTYMVDSLNLYLWISHLLDDLSPVLQQPYALLVHSPCNSFTDGQGMMINFNICLRQTIQKAYLLLRH